MFRYYSSIYSNKPIKQNQCHHFTLKILKALHKTGLTIIFPDALILFDAFLCLCQKNFHLVHILEFEVEPYLNGVLTKLGERFLPNSPHTIFLSLRAHVKALEIWAFPLT